MTTPTEIKALEKDFKAINECGPAWPALDGLLKAMKVYLKLLNGEHETLVIAPREPTEKMSDKGEFVNSEWLNDNAPLGQASYRSPAKAVYKSMVQAAQEERDAT